MIPKSIQALGAVCPIVLLFLDAPSQATVVYTYTSSSSNLLYVYDQPDTGLTGDTITISFRIASPLAPDSTYDISVVRSAEYVTSWVATDTRFGFHLIGDHAWLSVVPSPGVIEGGALYQCDLDQGTCFGGAVQTNSHGQIYLWNLLAASEGGSHLSFITCNTPDLGSIDALGFGASLEFNTLNGPTGTWAETAVPEPSARAMMLIGFLGFASARCLGTAGRVVRRFVRAA
jgi:hypothetical protein